MFLVSMDDFAAMNTVYARRSSREPYPARTTIGVAALPLGARIEIELVARRERRSPDRQRTRLVEPPASPAA